MISRDSWPVWTDTYNLLGFEALQTVRICLFEFLFFDPCRSFCEVFQKKDEKGTGELIQERKERNTGA